MEYLMKKGKKLGAAQFTQKHPIWWKKKSVQGKDRIIEG